MPADNLEIFTSVGIPRTRGKKIIYSAFKSNKQNNEFVL